MFGQRLPDSRHASVAGPSRRVGPAAPAPPPLLSKQAACSAASTSDERRPLAVAGAHRGSFHRAHMLHLSLRPAARLRRCNSSRRAGTSARLGDGGERWLMGIRRAVSGRAARRRTATIITRCANGPPSRQRRVERGPRGASRAPDGADRLATSPVIAPSSSATAAARRAITCRSHLRFLPAGTTRRQFISAGTCGQPVRRRPLRMGGS